MSANLFYVDLYNGRICSETGSPVSFPEVVAGGTLSFSLRFLEFSGASFVDSDPDIAAIRVGIGAIDERPISGQYRLKIGLGSPNPGVNLTQFLDAAASAMEVEAALNALSAKASPFSCMEVSGSIMIRRTDGLAETLSVSSNRLVPVSFGRITGVLVDGEWSYELRLSVAPLAFADTATRLLPDAPALSTLVQGGSDSTGKVVWNEIQRLYVPSRFKGTYQIRYGDYLKSALLDVKDTAESIEQAINDMLTLPDATSLGTVVVTNPSNEYANIEFTGGLGGKNIDQMTVSVFNAPGGDWTFDLPMDRAEMFFALRQSQVLTLPFEGEADFYIDPADPTQGTVTRKLWQTTIRVRRPQIMPDLATVPGIDWLRANPVDYVPFTTDQIVAGPQIYSSVVGNGASDTFSIAHGMNTSAIANIVVRRNSGEWDVLAEGTDYDATIVSANEVQLAFGTAPAPNDLLVYVQSAPNVRQWEPHTHTQSQVVGLSGLLDNMLGRIVKLENLLPQPGVAGVTTTGKKAGFELPDVGEILPDVASLETDKTLASQIIVAQSEQTFPAGTQLADLQIQQTEQEEAIKNDPDALPPNVLYRLVLPGVGKVGKKGREEVLGEDGQVATPAVPDEPSLPSLWPARSPAMMQSNRWPILLPALGEAPIRIDLGKYFPPKGGLAYYPDGIPTSGFYGARTFGPFDRDVRITGTINADDSLYINGSLLVGANHPFAGSVNVDMTLSAGMPLVVDVQNFSSYGQAGASGILTVVPTQSPLSALAVTVATQVPSSMIAGSIYEVGPTGGLLLPGGLGRKSQFVPKGELFGTDGRCFYRLIQDNFRCFPQEMDRELWRVFLGDEQLPVGAKLSIRGELRTRMLGDFFDDDARGVGRVDYGAQYVLKCEAVPLFGTANLGNVASVPIVLGQTRITLSPALEVFAWSLSIRRDALSMVSSWSAYRSSTSGGNFSLPATIRLRLTNFDIDDASPDPRGQVALVMPATRLEVTV